MKKFVLYAVAAALVSVGSITAQAAPLYDFEGGTDGFAGNGGGATVASSTIGATSGTGSILFSVVSGATFVGAQNGNFPAAFGNPPGVDSITFDLTLLNAFAGGFADLTISAFGATKPMPGQVQQFLNTQFDSSFALGGRAPGTYAVQLDLDSGVNPLTFNPGESFNQIFGPGPNQLIPTAFQFTLNKSNSSASAVDIYIDNVQTVNASAVPEPSSIGMLCLAGTAIAYRVRQKSKKTADILSA